MIRLVDHPIDTQEVLDAVRDTRAGAVVLFLGTVREFTGDRQTRSLDYEAYAPMAVAELQRVVRAATARWPVVRATVVHRVGHLELGDVAVAVAVSTAHRREAFEAGQWLMDRIKECVPIWKCENWADGRQEWVHPTDGVAGNGIARSTSAGTRTLENHAAAPTGRQMGVPPTPVTEVAHPADALPDMPQNGENRTANDGGGELPSARREAAE